MQVWSGGSGVFPGEPYLYGRQEWDQNRPHAGSRGWELTGDVSKGLNEVPDAELPVARKEPDSAATAISESSSGYNLQPQVEQKEIEHMGSENFEAKGDSRSASKSLEAPQGAQLLTSMLSKNGAVFCKSYLSRISVSHDLVESELYKRCISLLGDLGIAKAPVRNELTQVFTFVEICISVSSSSFSILMLLCFMQQVDGNAGKITQKYGSTNSFSSLYLKSNNTIFQASSHFAFPIFSMILYLKIEICLSAPL